MQAFPRVSLQKSLFSRKNAANLASFLVNPLLASSECLRVATPSLPRDAQRDVITEQEEGKLAKTEEMCLPRREPVN